MQIRHATMEDIKQIVVVEERCFPPAEAAREEDFRERLSVYPNHFWLLLDGENIVSLVNGMVTDEADLRDEMYEDAGLHDENGKW